ncbi:Tyrosine--tRNA ligase, mitochondrial [Aphelenchoides besseyi]|nr:Tyrosine--tRNA ligase, mitochondrial [Aphelenchoides besseyi]
MVRLKSNAFGGDHKLLFFFCRELQRRKLIASSHPHNILEPNNIHFLRQLPGNGVYAVCTSLFGCNPIAVIGGATAMIGDPTGRSTDRPELTREFVGENSRNILRQLAEVLENGRSLFGDRIRLTILNNSEWYENMNMVDFLRIGRGFRVGEMLRMGPIRARLENNGISFAEFSYQILQSFDWYMLSRKHDCYFQLGGSDQLGHLDSGADFIKRKSGSQPIGLGKSSVKNGSPVWLDGTKTSPFALYQYFRQFHDDVAESLLTYFSLRPFEQVEEILAHHRENLGKWIAQKAVAEEMVSLIHGRTALEKAIQCSNVLFNGSLKDFENLDHDTIGKIFAGPLTFQLSKQKVTTIADLADATKTKGAAMVPTGAFKLNGTKVTDPNLLLSNHSSLMLKSRYSLICWGKRNFYLVDWRE